MSLEGIISKIEFKLMTFTEEAVNCLLSSECRLVDGWVRPNTRDSLVLIQTALFIKSVNDDFITLKVMKVSW